jgi:hypothetical protein
MNVLHRTRISQTINMLHKTKREREKEREWLQIGLRRQKSAPSSYMYVHISDFYADLPKS